MRSGGGAIRQPERIGRCGKENKITILIQTGKEDDETVVGRETSATVKAGSFLRQISHPAQRVYGS